MIRLLSYYTLIVGNGRLLVLCVLLQNHAKAVVCSCRVRVDFNCVGKVLLSTLTLILTGKQGGQMHASAKMIAFEREALLEKLHTFLVLHGLFEADTGVVVGGRLGFTLLTRVRFLRLNRLFEGVACSLPILQLKVHFGLKK